MGAPDVQHEIGFDAGGRRNSVFVGNLVGMRISEKSRRIRTGGNCVEYAELHTLDQFVNNLCQRSAPY